MALKARVFIVKHDHQADHKVCFVEHDHQQQNQQIISPGELVDREHKADVKVFIVEHAHQASIKITRKNFPK